MGKRLRTYTRLNCELLNFFCEKSYLSFPEGGHRLTFTTDLCGTQPFPAQIMLLVMKTASKVKCFSPSMCQSRFEFMS